MKSVFFKSLVYVFLIFSINPSLFAEDKHDDEIYYEQAVRYNRQLDIMEHQSERFEKLLERWEKQADRYDAILDAWEKQTKVKNNN